MLVDYNSDILSIRFSTPQISTSLKSQLLFWGFNNITPLDFIYQGQDSKELILKIISYVTKYSFDYNLSSEAQLYLQSILEDKEKFNLVKNKARDYKNGDYSSKDFKNFKLFLKTSIKRKLKRHQEKAAFHLYLLGNGANFSVPGSGKTSVVLTVYEKLRLEGKVNKLLVVGPPSSFGPWKDEFFSTLGREAEVQILAGTNKRIRSKIYYYSNSELYLTTYQSLLYDQSEIDYFLTNFKNKAFLVIDEAHYIKQVNGNWANAVIGLATKVEYKCVLTGTPSPKSYADFFNLFDFLWPLAQPISNISKTQLKYYEQIGDADNAKELLDQEIGSLFYRVRKNELGLKPQIFNDPIIISMNKYERIIYDSIYKNIKQLSKRDYLNKIDFINKVGKSRIIRLRQAVSYCGLLSPMILNDSGALLKNDENLDNIIFNYDKLEKPAKLERLLEILALFKKKKLKVVIWANFIDTINLIEKNLLLNNFNCKKIFGSTPIDGPNTLFEETREKIRDEFIDKDSGLDILIANPAACSESISLHKTCQNAIYYDLSYNAAQYIQSLDRIHRVGGSEFKDVNYYYLQYENSIEQDIKLNVEQKRDKMNEIIDQEYSIYSLDMSEGDEDLDAYKRLFLK